MGRKGNEKKAREKVEPRVRVRGSGGTRVCACVHVFIYRLDMCAKGVGVDVCVRVGVRVCVRDSVAPQRVRAVSNQIV